MKKDNNLPTETELLQNLIELSQFPEYLNDLKTLRLKRLLKYLNELINSKLEFINKQLIICEVSNYIYPPEYIGNEFMYWGERFTQSGFNYYGLEHLKIKIENRIKELNKEPKPEYNDLIFKDAESENFFKWIVETWIKPNNNQKTALSYLFFQMWYKEPGNCQFKIKCTQPFFAKYWNEKYTELKTLNTKDPKFKKDITSKLYEMEFNSKLTEYLNISYQNTKGD